MYAFTNIILQSWFAAPTSQASQRLFFGLVPGLAGLLNPNRPIVCPTCKVCAANQVCVTPPAPAAFAALATGGR